MVVNHLLGVGARDLLADVSFARGDDEVSHVHPKDGPVVDGAAQLGPSGPETMSHGSTSSNRSDSGTQDGPAGAQLLPEVYYGLEALDRGRQALSPAQFEQLQHTGYVRDQNSVYIVGLDAPGSDDQSAAPAAPESALARAGGPDLLRAAAAAEHNGSVQPLPIGYGTWPPNDPLRAFMRNLDLIKLPDAFNALASLNPRPAYVPIVAVLDSGIVADHPDLKRMLVPGFDFVSDLSSAADGDGPDANPDDSEPAGPAASFHGTGVAGTIAAETFNGVGVVGVAPMARIMPVRVMGVNPIGSWDDLIQGILFASGLPNSSGTLPARRADVINMSLRGRGGCPAAVLDAIAQARGQGVIVVAGTGNDDGAPVGTPANCPGVVAVSAIGYDGQLAAYSNVGPEVVVTAPGGDLARIAVNVLDVIFSTSATFVGANGTTRISNYTGTEGTSDATAHVAGAMALMRAVNPNLMPAQVDLLFAIGSLTDDVGATGRDTKTGFGLINALKGIRAASDGPELVDVIDALDAYPKSSEALLEELASLYPQLHERARSYLAAVRSDYFDTTLQYFVHNPEVRQRLLASLGTAHPYFATLAAVARSIENLPAPELSKMRLDFGRTSTPSTP